MEKKGSWDPFFCGQYFHLDVLQPTTRPGFLSFM